MLVIHGAYDYRVPDIQGISTFTILQRRGIPRKLITTKEAPSSSNGTFWPSLLRIQNPNGECTFEPFVQCTVCHQILAYEPRNGTSTISYHVQNCIKKTVSNKEISIKKYLKKDATISLEDKQMITLACSKYCAFDMQSFNSVNGNGFQQ
ncbi:unnamed protein product [Rotaria magnacalcarata]|nr:unnamed protein product [Rotaria magnacalcarata]CAF1644233.1 unnamed protein product [Rotaria magnacalcarata]CAF2087787.1 unnamed protein product [Rotaria magnacalcarata]CAF3785139.1 unnamed protein product [Rotaria magnacalcarata]CAF3787171.1 unnamed protein product [Rotaria magnacalcarata]